MGVGLACMVAPLVSLAVTALMGLLSDTFKIHRRVFLAWLAGYAASVGMFYFLPDIYNPPMGQMAVTVLQQCSGENTKLEICFHDSPDSNTSKFASLRENDQYDAYDGRTTVKHTLNCTLECQTLLQKSINSTADVYHEHPLTFSLHPENSQITYDVCKCGNCTIINNTWLLPCDVNKALCTSQCSSERGGNGENELTLQKLFRSVEYWCLAVFYLLIYIGYMATNTLADTACIALLGQENCHKFGHQFLWGMLAWGSVAVVCGAMVDYYSHGRPDVNYGPLFIITVSFLLLCLPVSCRIKFNLPKKKFEITNVYLVICSVKAIIFLVSHTICSQFLSHEITV